MLAAHLIPGYFAAIKSQPNWKSEWSKTQRILLWTTAMGSTIAPDIDVIYNVLFRGFFNHSTLWTHSLFLYLGIGLIWWLLYYIKKVSFLQVTLGLIVEGGLSHLILDVIAHNTPLLYPFSMTMFGMPPARVVEGGILAYLTDPIFLLEPLASILVVWHWMLQRNFYRKQVRTVILTVVSVSFILFAVGFLWFLPDLQKIAQSFTTGHF